ncbi:MAG: ABC transporter substrate-binding protein [Nitrospirota bacterium]
MLLEVFGPHQEGIWSAGKDHPADPGSRPPAVPKLRPRTPFLALATSVLFCVGCTTQPESVFRIGTNIWPGYEPLHMAKAQGYLEESVRLVEYSSATQVIHEFRNGAIEAAALTLDEVLLLMQYGQTPQVVLVLDVSLGGDVILGQRELHRLADIRGHRVGVENTALGAYVLSRALEKAGLTQADITIVPLAVDQHANAFRKRAVDAVVTFEPVRSQLMTQGANPLFDSSQIPGEILDVLVVRADRMKSHIRQVDTLVRGWFEALRFLQQHPDEAAALVSKRLGIKPEEVAAAYKGLHFPDVAENHAYLSGRPSGLLKAAQRLTAVMTHEQLLDREFTVHEISESGPLDTLSQTIHAPRAL